MTCDVHAIPLSIYFGISAKKVGPKLRAIVLTPFKKWKSFNNSRKDGKFGID